MIFNILLFLTFTYWCQGHVNPIVSTPSGKIEGTTSLKSRLGKTIFSFRGIRYAKPPVGDLRFQPPIPSDPWQDVYNATADGPFCPQRPFPNENFAEDCLIVNVYSTKLPNEKGNPKRPVIVHIHPGAFYAAGSGSNLVGPQYLMDQDMVLVTFNYRLGILGFISTGDSVAPGNNGLKDQILLLKWVKKHIKSFGGDPDNITLQGYSAGGWSVIFHMVSPKSKGLFHKGIVMSSGIGSVTFPRHQLQLVKQQAGMVGCPDDTSANMINCFKKIPAESLEGQYQEFGMSGFDPDLIWIPVVDGEYLPDDPIRLVIQGRFQKIPLMIGQTKDETGERAYRVIISQTLTDQINNNFEEIAPFTFLYESGTELSRNISRAIKSFYLHDKPVDKSQLDNLSKLYSDSIIGFGTHRGAKLMAQYSTKPVYRYCFTFQGRWSHFYIPGTNNTWGVVHHDDQIYMFHIPLVGFPLIGKDSPKPEVDMVEKLTALHANFARNGKPIPEPSSKLDNTNWPPFDLKSEIYMDMGEKLVLREKLYEDRFAFWEKLYPLSMFQ